MPLPARKSRFGSTPTTLRYTSAGRARPSPRSTRSAPPFTLSALGWVRVRTFTPLASHHRWISALAVGFIIRRTMYPLRTRIVRSTPRESRPSMMMQPTNPAPICTMCVPGRALAMMVRAS